MAKLKRKKRQSKNKFDKKKTKIGKIFKTFIKGKNWTKNGKRKKKENNGNQKLKKGKK